MTEILEIKKQIFANQKYFEAVLPRDFDVNKFMATLSLEVQKNPKLGHCSNLIEVAKDVASFGLIIGGLAQQSYLIPYTKKSKEDNQWTETTTAQLIIGYKGYVAKLEEAGYSIEVELVTKEELNKGFFQETRGSNPQIIHNPIRSGIRDRDNIALAYCILSKDGKQTFCVLSKEEIEEMAKTEKWITGNDGKKSKTRGLGNVWESEQRTTDFGQMCLKTVIRNAVKKVNLRIANEMSTYEGKRDEQIINVTPKIKSISEEQESEIKNILIAAEISETDFCKVYKINSVADLPVSKFEEAKTRLVVKAQEVMNKKEEVKDANN